MLLHLTQMGICYFLNILLCWCTARILDSRYKIQVIIPSKQETVNGRICHPLGQRTGIVQIKCSKCEAANGKIYHTLKKRFVSKENLLSMKYQVFLVLSPFSGFFWFICNFAHYDTVWGTSLQKNNILHVWWKNPLRFYFSLFVKWKKKVLKMWEDEIAFRKRQIL